MTQNTQYLERAVTRGSGSGRLKNPQVGVLRYRNSGSCLAGFCLTFDLAKWRGCLVLSNAAGWRHKASRIPRAAPGALACIQRVISSYGLDAACFGPSARRVTPLVRRPGRENRSRPLSLSLQIGTIGKTEPQQAGIA